MAGLGATTLFDAALPFSLSAVKKAAGQTVLNPETTSTSLTLLKNAFSPTPIVSLLAPATTSVLLTEQALDKPAILKTSRQSELHNTAPRKPVVQDDAKKAESTKPSPDAQLSASPAFIDLTV